MNDDALRGFARAFCDALTLRDPQRIAPYLHEDIDWTGFGPIDLFPFLGRRHSIRAVLQVCSEIADMIELKECVPESMLVAGDQAAALMRVNALLRKNGKPISLRLAQFIQLRDGKVASVRMMLDSFDAAEQVLGRAIDLTNAA
ncbi:MAG: nuclear transport factor 2 family protein [Pseudolabrys sp.]|nr:nuclear transport factor 2 family protein [Pseudolabrys sp.]MBV9261819.1 nuclear transport factor 2 family protein [Pseudolabrys sp.]